MIDTIRQDRDLFRFQNCRDIIIGDSGVPFTPFSIIPISFKSFILCDLAVMALDDLLENWANFSLTAEEEATEVDVDRQAALVTSQALRFNLIRKLLAPRLIASDVMRRTFKSA